MKIVIVGAGISGIATAILLQSQGHDVQIYERTAIMNTRGNAFLMHDDGLRVLRKLARIKGSVEDLGKHIDFFQLYSEGFEEIKALKLSPWRCMKRVDIMEFLYPLVAHNSIFHGHEFSHFNFKDGKAVSAAFANGAIVEGDLFIGADGANSMVRQSLFGPTKYSDVEVMELLSTLNSPRLSSNLERRFVKHQHRAQSIAFGVIPVNQDEVVWVLQFDPKLVPAKDLENNNYQALAQLLSAEFSDDVKEIIAEENFSNSYIWKARDFDLLPEFHHQNIFLIGDSAHVALPFSSSGTTNALVDAATFSKLFKSKNDLEGLGEMFYRKRAPNVAMQIDFGRQIKNDFLNPEKQALEEQKIPLVEKKLKPLKHIPEDQVVRVVYFTDPICSTCWTIQPQLRKLQLQYGNQLQIEYKMGGLLPDWESFERGGIKEPSDVAIHWTEVCLQYHMPINGEFWNSDPLPSSYPPSVAFKAAQMQDTDKAVLFLRNIRDLLFIQQKNIIEPKFLYLAALEGGLDAARLMRDIDGKAMEYFKSDLDLVEALRVTVLPTLVFSNDKQQRARLEGHQSYEHMVDIIMALNPRLKKLSYSKDPIALFRLFHTMTIHEFTFLTELDQTQALKEIDRLIKKDLIVQIDSPAGALWARSLKLQHLFS